MKNRNLFSYNWDAQSQVPYLDGISPLETFVSFDDKKSIGIKASYIMSHAARGAMIWEITGDYTETTPGSGILSGTPLADTLKQVLCAYTTNLSTHSPATQSTLFFPNPGKCDATSYLYYKANGYVQIELYDLSGRLLKKTEKGPEQGGQYELFQVPAAGSYYIHLINGNEVQTLKWIVN